MIPQLVVSDGAQLSCTPLEPFGLIIQPTDRDGAADLTTGSTDLLRELVADARVLVLQGFAPMSTADLARFSRRWGDVLEWDFGSVLDLAVQDDPQSYLFTSGDVPFHWDGAFAQVTPSYLVFQCLQAPETGGETLFCDTTAIVKAADPQTRRHWRRIRITYTTEKLAHYGGRVTADFVSSHPKTGVPTLRYAEPLDASRFLNPLALEIEGTSPDGEEEFLADMRERLYSSQACYAHPWRPGDVVIADNHVLLHGRRSFPSESARRLQRVHIV